MPKFYSLDLLEDLQNEVGKILKQFGEFKKLDNESLNRPPAEGKWSVAQVIEHLNFYNQYYLPVIEFALAQNRHFKFDPIFKSGFLGNYFTQAMLPKDGKVKNKTKAFKSYSPQVKLNSEEVMGYFEESEATLIDLLQQSKHTDLAGIRIPISISKLIKLKLGDTFRFLIAHQTRHFVQIQEALLYLKSESGPVH